MAACWAVRWGLRKSRLGLCLHFASISPVSSSNRYFFATSCNSHNGDSQHGVWRNLEWRVFLQYSFHSSPHLSSDSSMLHEQKTGEDVVSVDVCDGKPKPKRKKLKGRREVVKFLKFLRWKKKKDYDGMTAEERILFKLRKAREKEVRIVEAMNKIEPPDPSDARVTHDPEILTPEEHFYLLKMGSKCKNYVPVGRRGIYQGVILNMHLHWKKHQTLKVVVKTFTPVEVREIAAELARLSGGIVLDIVDDDTIIMYRGKNYSQPPTEIMSPRITLTRKKALDKSKYRDALRAVRKFIPRLEQDLEDLHEKMKDGRIAPVHAVNQPGTAISTEAETENEIISDVGSECDTIRNGAEDETIGVRDSNERGILDRGSCSESDDLSDMFSTDVSEAESEGSMEKPLYLDQLEMFPSDRDSEPEDFEKHLREISAASRAELKVSDLDEVDKIFLRAGSLLKKKKR